MGLPGAGRQIPGNVRLVFHARSFHAALQHHRTTTDREGAFLMTTVQEIEHLLNAYRAWLKDKTTLREVNGSWVEITTPYVDRHNDALQIYARSENDSYVLTDDSYTVRDLEAR